MTIKELKEELQSVEESWSANCWMERRLVSQHKILSFEEGGKAVRLVMTVLGKPTSTPQIKGFHDVRWNTNNEQLVKLASDLLQQNQIMEKKSFKMWTSRSTINPAFYHGRIELTLPPDVYASSFYTSDDPKEWKRLNDLRTKPINKRPQKPFDLEEVIKKAKIKLVEYKVGWKPNKTVNMIVGVFPDGNPRLKIVFEPANQWTKSEEEYVYIHRFNLLKKPKDYKNGYWNPMSLQPPSFRYLDLLNPPEGFNLEKFLREEYEIGKNQSLS